MSNPRLKAILVYASIGFIIFIIFISLSNTGQRIQEIGFTDLVGYVKAGNVKHLEVTGNQIVITFDDNHKAATYKSPESTAQEQLIQFG
ncbi:MAG TPA: ATP-dependent metallopeptidase FtsH/Yme1/Tma family protein, partial [Spirillospora sp.]|nr:ATP-dependent metallopeptidase FtsH/Yme1/Tma family protein [Spirillospora sp.]